MHLSFAATAGLGAVAGCTIMLGLPVARLGRPGPRRMAFLNAASVGVLLFILYDVLKHAGAAIDDAISAGDRGTGIGYAALLAAGLSVGVLGLVVFEKLTLRRLPRPSGPGAMASTNVAAEAVPARSAGAQVALFIAIGIGLHNFSEGLAIGQSAASGTYQLMWLLVIGFGLHNVTEGFGITGPIARERPSWAFLGVLGLIGGGPTFVGTLLGYQFTNVAVSVLFLALAAGAIIYVIGELQHAGRKIGSHDVAMVGLLTGFLVAFGTDLILTIAGA